MVDKGIGPLAIRQAAPLHFSKPIRESVLLVRCVIDHNRQQKWQVRCHQVASVDRELPFEPKVSFASIVSVLRDYRNEQRAALYLAANRHIPGISPAQLALIEPHLDARGAQRVAQLLRSFGVLGGVAQEHRSARIGHGVTVDVVPLSLSGSARLAIQGLFVSAP
jgi:hypothetical protein